MIIARKKLFSNDISMKSSIVRCIVLTNLMSVGLTGFAYLLTQYLFWFAQGASNVTTSILRPLNLDDFVQSKSKVLFYFFFSF